jgi:hypothetical protein
MQLQELIEDIGSNVYSLIVDESTDITICKMMGIIIRYFSISTKKVVSRYLGMLHIENGTVWPCFQLEARVALQVDSQPRAGPSTIGRFPSQRQPPLYKLALDSNQRDSHRLLQLPGLWDFRIRQSRRLGI